MALILCADIGSSSLKTALINGSGELCGEARVPYGEEPGPGCWLKAFRAAAGSLPDGAAPDALVISGSGPTLVPVIEETNGALKSLPPVYWYDAPLRIEGRPEVFLPSFFLSKAVLFRKQCPAAFERLAYFFSPQEWLSWKLGAGPVTVLPHAAYEPWFWDGGQCAALHLKQDLFPPFVSMGTVIGAAKPADPGEPALLYPGLPIIAGASDFITALIGTGTLSPGTACDRTGSSEGLNLCTASVPGNPETLPASVRILPGAAEGLWNLGVVIGKSGKLLDEYRAENHRNKDAAELMAEILDNPSHPGRPVLEAMGGAFLGALDDLDASGRRVTELVLSGGQSRDPRWNRHKARISGRTLHVPEITHAELAGNAVLGILALEKKPVCAETLREKAGAMIRIRETFKP